MSTAAAASQEPGLADRARNGDRTALVQLYRRYREPLYRHACRMLADEAAARDMVQEAFARAVVAVKDTRPGLNFRAWIYRITTNLCLRELTHRGRSRPEADADGVEHVSPHATSVRHQVGQQLAAALARLPDRYRQVLLLREVDELTYAELARVLEVSESNVKVLLHRARRRFAALFVAQRLRAEPGSLAVSCAELQRLLQRPLQSGELERHLERCERCRQLEHRPAAELLALLPVPPAVALPDAPLARSAGLGAGGAASSILVGAMVMGAVLLVAGTVVAGMALLRPSAAVPATSRGSEPLRPTTTTAKAPAPPVTAAPDGGPPAYVVGGRAQTRRARAGRRRVNGRRQRVERVVHQAVDPEAPPSH